AFVWISPQRGRLLMMLGVAVIAAFLAWPLISEQIIGALGQKAGHEFLSLAYWFENLGEVGESLPRVLTLWARQEHGAAGYLLAPFTISFFAGTLIGCMLVWRPTSKYERAHLIGLV